MELTNADKAKLNALFNEADDEELESLLDAIKEYKKEYDKKEKEKDVVKCAFSKNCSLKVEVKGDEDNSHSEVSVECHGVKGLPDVMVLGISVMSFIAEKFPEHKVELLAEICSIALAGDIAGIYTSKEAMLKAEAEAKEEE